MGQTLAGILDARDYALADRFGRLKKDDRPEPVVALPDSGWDAFNIRASSGHSRGPAP